jgi:hypothetical protein
MGVYGDFEIATKKMIRVEKKILHDESVERLYHDKFSTFKELYNILKDKFGVPASQTPKA